MKNSIIVMLLSLTLTQTAPQLPSVSWSATVKSIGAGQYELHLKAAVKRPWHIYSQELPPGGPVPTQIIFKDPDKVRLIGKANESGKVIRHHDAAFGMYVNYYSDSVDFVQNIRVSSSSIRKVSGAVTYMLCNDHQCQQPTTTAIEWELH